MTKEIKNIDEDVAAALEVLKRGGVILYPTDTVWGIGCDATRSEAVKRIFEIKKRADSKAMIAAARPSIAGIRETQAMSWGFLESIRKSSGLNT